MTVSSNSNYFGRSSKLFSFFRKSHLNMKVKSHENLYLTFEKSQRILPKRGVGPSVSPFSSVYNRNINKHHVPGAGGFKKCYKMLDIFFLDTLYLELEICLLISTFFRKRIKMFFEEFFGLWNFLTIDEFLTFEGHWKSRFFQLFKSKITSKKNFRKSLNISIRWISFTYNRSKNLFIYKNVFYEDV